MRFLLVIAALLTAPAATASEFSVAPLRNVLSAEHPAAEFRISNPTDRILEARLSWIDLAAAPEGYVAASAKQRALLSAAPYLTLQPAFVRIEPGGAAIIKVALKPGSAPPVGERRSHLFIETAAARNPLRRTSGLELDIGLGVSTPVILRWGKGEASAKIGAARFVRSPEGLLLLETTIEPGGEYSAYGYLTADFLEPSGVTRSLGDVQNVSAFVDSRRRVYAIPLNARDLPAGRIRVSFAGSEEFSGKTFAVREFNVGAPRSANAGSGPPVNR